MQGSGRQKINFWTHVALQQRDPPLCLKSRGPTMHEQHVQELSGGDGFAGRRNVCVRARTPKRPNAQTHKRTNARMPACACLRGFAHLVGNLCGRSVPGGSVTVLSPFRMREQMRSASSIFASMLQIPGIALSPSNDMQMPPPLLPRISRRGGRLLPTCLGSTLAAGQNPVNPSAAPAIMQTATKPQDSDILAVMVVLSCE